MEKYGVDEKLNDDEKRAAVECPKCGSELADPATTGGVLVCPKCGTEPFEG